MEEKWLVTPIMTMIMESLKSTGKSFTIRTHGYSHETRPVLDCTRVRVSRRTSSFSLACLKVQKVHNVHNSPIGTSRLVCACAQPTLNRSTVKLIKTGLLMTYPTIHTCIRIFNIRCIINNDLICSQFKLSIIPLDKQFMYNTTDAIFLISTCKLNYNIC